MTPFRYPKVFVSATSRGLKPLRLAVADHFKKRQYEVVVQDDEGCDYQQIKDMLGKWIADCDAVVLVVGSAYGFEPTNWPKELARCSYTQFEYELAVELKIPIYRFIAADTFPLAPYPTEDEVFRQRQQDYIARLKGQDHVWYEFGSEAGLIAMLEMTRFHTLVKPNLPFTSLGKLFKGRKVELEAVRKSLLTRPAHATAVTSKQAIHGLGGVGKTRFAVEYAHQYATEYSARLYASADTPSALASNLAALVHVLNLPEADEKEQPKQLEAVERWLRMHAGWLLILDNVDTVEAQAAVNAYFPKLASGHVLVTSRLTSGWAGGVSAVELDTLAIPAATEFLLERTERDPAAPTKPARQVTATDPADAQALATDLGGLALALEQAGAYIGANRITFAAYRQRLTEVERDVLAWFDPAVMKYPKSVAVTWQASVNELNPDGKTLLNLLCWLAPDPIPVALIRTEPNAPPNCPIKSREKALKELSDYSLAKWNADGSSVTVHRLVQDVTRTRLSGGDGARSLRDGLRVLSAFLRGEAKDVRTWAGEYTPARPHVLIATEHADGLGNPVPTSRLLNVMAIHVNETGDYQASERLYRRALAIDEEQLGRNHPDVATGLNNLAGVLYLTGRFADAEPLFRRSLAIDEAAYGPDHPQVAERLNNLASLLQVTNRLAEAERLRLRELSINEAHFGPNHLTIGRGLNNMAELLRASGRGTEAEPMYERAVRIFEADRGANHPDVAAALGNWGLVEASTGRFAEAEPKFRRALTINEVSFGMSHPDVATALNNLGDLLRQTGRHEEAEPLLRRALLIDEWFYGSAHPNLAITLNNVATLCRVTNRREEADTLYRRALEILTRTCGAEHPYTLLLQANLQNLELESAAIKSGRHPSPDPTRKPGRPSGPSSWKK